MLDPNFPVDPARCARGAALAALLETDPVAKAEQARVLHAELLAGRVRLDIARRFAVSPTLPGRPARPELVEPRRLPRRSMRSPQGRATLLHALAHIEFNAINLALDAVWRFAGMPASFYADWLRVAAEEAHHYELLAGRLRDYGHAYGDFPAHDGLWEMCERTAGDVLARMALVPRTLEARGLDASPPIRARLAQAGDDASAAILDVILRDEVGHVAIGNRWFAICARKRRSTRIRPIYDLPSSTTRRTCAAPSISPRAATRASTRSNWPRSSSRIAAHRHPRRHEPKPFGAGPARFAC